MAKSFAARLETLERQVTPQHRHQGIISVPYGADPDEMLAQARAQCRAAGCNYGHIVSPLWKPSSEVTRSEWEAMVRDAYEGLDARGEMGG